MNTCYMQNLFWNVFIINLLFVTSSIVDFFFWNNKILLFQNESGPSERRPFSREVDLQVNRFDEAQKQAVLKKAQLLDNRFSAGESKFL